MDDAGRAAQGMTVRREVLGDEHVDRAVAATTPLTAPFQDFITRYAWGEVWSRPGLSRAERSMITLTALVVLRQEEELAMHLRAALRNGADPRSDRRGAAAHRGVCGGSRGQPRVRGGPAGAGRSRVTGPARPGRPCRIVRMTNGCTYRDHLVMMVSGKRGCPPQGCSPSCVLACAGQEDMAEIVSLADAVARAVHDGDSVAMEGFTHLIPFAAGREVIRQRRRDLTLIRMTPDVLYDQLIGAGCASKLIFSWGGNPGVGSLHRFRDAVENAWPGPLQLEEHSHAGMANRYVAGASGVPFAILRGYSGTGLEGLPGLDGQPAIRSVTCPFTGERLTAVAALNPDVAIIHAQRADRAGNVQLWGITGVQKEAVLSAQRSVVTVEEIVDELRPEPGAMVLPAWVVSYVAAVPGGSHPSYALGYSARDNDYYLAWDAISRDRERFSRWLAEQVLRRGGIPGRRRGWRGRMAA